MKLRYREGYRVFDFEDDNLTYYKDEMKELCRAIRREFPEGDIELVAMNGISYLSLDTEILRLMKEAGFTRLNLALVSSDTSCGPPNAAHRRSCLRDRRGGAPTG
jgi:uncharacterized Fe-S cluster-containing radical SAM superfamily enzyme